MGRKPVNKKRERDITRVAIWSKQLFPFFSAHGIREFSMDQAAEVLGCSKATIYRYCRSKEDLIRLVLIEKLSVLAGFRERLESESGNVESRYMNSLKFLVESTQDISSLLLRDLKVSYPDLWQEVSQFKQFAMEALESFYINEINKGSLRAVPVEILVELDEIFLEKLTSGESFRNGELTLAEALEAYFKLRLEGMLPKR
jgi:AcrR family transcriptional regulator